MLALLRHRLKWCMELPASVPNDENGDMKRARHLYSLSGAHVVCDEGSAVVPKRESDSLPLETASISDIRSGWQSAHVIAHLVRPAEAAHWRLFGDISTLILSVMI